MVTMLRAAPLTTSRKSLFKPTYLAYFYTTKEKQDEYSHKQLKHDYLLHYAQNHFGDI